jgi:hypothetical protein
MKIFMSEVFNDGLHISLILEERSIFKTQKKPLPIEHWTSDGDSKILTGLAALYEYLQDIDDPSASKIIIPHNKVAAMSEQEASALNFPTSVPYQLRIWSEGKLNDNSFQVQSEFLNMGAPVFIDNRVGSILSEGTHSYRIPSPLYELCEIVKNFPANSDEKLEAISQVSSMLGLQGSDIAADHLLTNIKLRHVAAFSAAVKGNLEDPELSPVLFSKHIVKVAEDNNGVIDEAQQLLTPDQGVSFSRQFKSNSLAKRTYLLENGEYIYIDPSIRIAMEGFRKVCLADKEVRYAFIKAPIAVLSSYIESNDNIDELLNVAFVETAQFSDRVIGIDKWKVPDLPFLVTERNEWGTELLIFEQIGSAHTVMIPKDILPEVVESLRAAIDAGDQQLSHNGINIPVRKDLLDEMEILLPIKPEPKPHVDPVEPVEDPDSDQDKGPYVVQTIDNFQVLNFTKNKMAPKHQLKYSIPRVLSPNTRLMGHQQDGVNWLIESFNQGIPGVLIADDMGLGKTLQALVLLALYREQVPKSAQKPTLIIAPTGLLKNWMKEVDTHLGGNGLGNILEAYGARLKSLKSSGVKGTDSNTGVPLLDTAKLSQADVVLTTYESYRDYAISFGRVSFGCVVFDEIQKVKNPRSRLSQAAKGVQGTFLVGLSGTPVENSLSDLHTILDILVPGALNLSLKDFMQFFSGDPNDKELRQALEKLKCQLLETIDGTPAIVLRRMKDEVFKDVGPNGKPMPKKHIVPAADTCQVMEAEQSAMYSDFSNRVQSRQIKMIEGLQAFKKISLSPSSPATWVLDANASILGSARLRETFKILDKIHFDKEKVLIFVESRAVQPQLAIIMKERYGMRKSPLIINGAISGDARQKSVDEFQKSEVGFNAMIVSPKAGGVGLTLTQANHVLHLERWWNPAVEDQCNDRSYRIGQERDVTIYTPVARHPELGDLSFDLVLDRILSRKRLLANSLFIPTELKPEDFGEIFNSREEGQIFRPVSLEESYEIETGEDFEDYVASSLVSNKFKINKTPRSHDGGCDLVASIDGEMILCQVKQVQTDKVLNNGVEQIVAAENRFPNANRLALITNAMSITRAQKDLAQQKKVIVICGEDIGNFGLALTKSLS